MRVQVRNAKGNRDRFVLLPENTLQILRRFWQTHRNPALLFPNRKCGLKKAHLTTTPLDRGVIQTTLRQVTDEAASVELENYYQTGGDLHIPLVTLHTLQDRQVPYWHELLYGRKLAAAGNQSNRFNRPLKNPPSRVKFD